MANLVIINVILFYFLAEFFFNPLFLSFVNLSWLIISYHLNFYNLRRYTKNVDGISRLLSQFIIFTFVYFAYFSFTNITITPLRHLKVLSLIFISISLFRSFYFYALRKYRIEGKNLRYIIFIGSNKNVNKIIEFFQNHSELGYHILGNFYDNQNGSDLYLGNVDSVFEYILENEVDEIYCSISELSKTQINSFIDFADNNLIVLKLLPDAKDVYTTKMNVEYFDYMPVLSLRSIPFDNTVNQFIKRLFDILFSVFVIVFILSWMSPLLFILIKFDSKGPLIFKQTRDGLNGKHFICYKYRSMYLNDLADDIQATKQDERITKFGTFLRKTSIDELPQFINVLLGEMSVVGPRPHMQSQTKKYAKIVDKFMVRHFIKPGITGLAQVRGYRGEVEKNEDMGNRIKLDIFYIENWSFLLDLKIIGQTIINTVRGEDKAY